MNMFSRLLHREAPQLIERRVPIAGVGSYDAERRSFEAVIATATPILGKSGMFETLDLNAGRWAASISFLDTHGRNSIDRVLGTVTNLRVQGNELWGTVTLSKHAERAERLHRELADGHRTFGVSVGFDVTQWKDAGQRDGKRERIAAAWNLHEASICPVAADPAAGIREGSTMLTTAPAAGSRAATNTAIRQVATTLGLTREWCDGQIDAEATIEQANAAALAAVQARAATTTSAISTVTRARDLDDQEGRVSAMGEALYARANPRPQISDRARAFVGLSYVEMARETLRSAGHSVTGLSAGTIIERATSGFGGLHSTSDFPLALGDAVGRVLRESYRAAPSPLRQIARRVTVPDFRPRATIRMTSSLGLERVGEGGEFKGGTLLEAGESYKVETYGKIVGLTRQAMINDDIGALTDIPRLMGAAAANFESRFIADLFSANPIMADGELVFSVAHANDAATPGPIDTTNLSEARLAMRSQTDEDGEIVGAVPKYLIVAPDRETEAEVVLSDIAAATSSDVNVFSGQLTLIVEPRLPPDTWYVVADPAVLPSIEIATLEGQTEPEVRTEVGFDIDGTRFRIRLDLGGGWVDHRGAFRNTGEVA